MKSINIPRSKIHKKKIGKYEYYTFRYRDKQFYAKDIKTLNKKFNDYLLEESSTVIAKGTIGELYEVFLKDKELELKHNTIVSYKSNFNVHIKNSGLSSISMDNCKDSDVLKFLKSTQLTFSSKKLLLTQLKVFFNWGIKRKFCEVNPCVGIVLKNDSIVEEKEKFVPVGIREMVLNNCPTNQYMYLKVMMETGTRLSETLAITKEDVLEEKDITWLRINKQLIIIDGVPTIITPKNTYSNRKIPISKELGELIKNYNYKRPSRYAITKYLQKFGLHCHQFRSTFITEQIQQGKNIQYVKMIVGHSINSNVLEKNYLRIQEQFLIDEFNK